MRYANVAIQSFGHELPPRVVASTDLEAQLGPLYSRLNLPPGRIEMISGVRERRFWEPGTRPSMVSARTARAALQAAGVERSQVGALLHTSVCRDFLEPATASVVAGALELPREAMVFDISNACLGFMNGLVTVANMIELGQIQAGVVVATEAGEALVDATVADLNARSRNGIDRRKLKPSFASLTIGSGSVAAVLVHSSLAKPGAARLLGGAFAQATEHNSLCRSAPDRGFASGAHPLMETDAEAVLANGCTLAEATWVDFKQQLGWTNETPDRIFCHQVGTSHRRALFKALGLEVEEAYPTVEWLGNIGSVSLPIGLALAAEESKIEAGERLALLGIGSGLNCLMLAAEWT